MKVEHWALGIALLVALSTSSAWSSLMGLWGRIGLASLVWQSFAWALSANLGESWTMRLLLALVVFGSVTCRVRQ
ncbi:MAG TPA: hypothetical protein VEJ67_02225 [Candidatus Cybelea sp.]|nr:hypothetical protein [Candidatus Cybelea sp.]